MAAYTNTTIIADVSDVDGFKGENVSANFTEAMEDLVGVYTEAYLCAIVKHDIVGNWGELNATYKLLFSEYACRMVAIEAIKYDMSVFNRIIAEDMINLNWARVQQIESLLKEADKQDFLGA